METCEICGETKKHHLFYKLKYFGVYNDRKCIWCRDCQKMFMDMMKIRKRRAALEEKTVSLFVTFE